MPAGLVKVFTQGCVIGAIQSRMCVCGTKQDMRENFDRANAGEIWLHRLVCCSEANPIYVFNDLKHREDPPPLPISLVLYWNSVGKMFNVTLVIEMN